MADMTEVYRTQIKGMIAKTDPDIRNLANAIVNLYEWKDGALSDAFKLLGQTKDLSERLSRLESRLTGIEARPTR